MVYELKDTTKVKDLFEGWQETLIYTRYREGIEIEVDTAEAERRKHLALVACSALIVRCLEEGLYPS